ncbi:MAG: 50S ribosomal protein L2 [Mycoplasmataceae bacterium]|nr:50S ribosomal protein L2 [Mycoplasmataceae bacterium]
MAIKYIKARSKGKRTSVLIDYSQHLTTDQPEKSLIKHIHNQSGRNNRGVITTRHQGGRQKRQYRLIDFLRSNPVKATVKTIEYDPNRTAFISLIVYENGQKSYIIAPQGIKVGDEIISGDKVDIKIGNTMLIKNIPEGTFIHNIELSPRKGGQLARSAGSSAQVLGKDETGAYTIVKLSSGEVRKILNDCRATIGAVSNENHNLVNLGKAGRSRHLGIRPTVRGSAMNPNDHPHGGGEGRQPVGYDAPRTPWGKRHMGVKTRKQKKASSTLIIRRRNKK